MHGLEYLDAESVDLGGGDRTLVKGASSSALADNAPPDPFSNNEGASHGR